MTPDVFTTEQRSALMKKVRSKNTAWEVAFRALLWRRGLRYRLHYGPYHIDIAFVSEKVAVFLDSCFWHYCLRHGELPHTNREFWKTKLEGNRRRDESVTRALRKRGWIVVRLWSHDF